MKNWRSSVHSLFVYIEPLLATEANERIQKHVQVISEGRWSKERAAELLAGFRRDYPTLVRAVKTRSTSQTVLMHKSRFVHGMLKAGLLQEKEGNQLLVCLLITISIFSFSTSLFLFGLLVIWVFRRHVCYAVTVEGSCCISCCVMWRKCTPLTCMQELIHARVKALYFCAPTIDLPTTYDVIHKHYLFEHFNDMDLKHILESGDIVVYNPNQALFSKGQPPLRVFVILRGSATRSVRFFIMCGKAWSNFSMFTSEN